MSIEDRLLLGYILVERQLITQEQLTACLREQASRVERGEQRRLLGELLVEYNLIVGADRDAALAEQRRRIADTTIGPYRIVDKLGQGGMGAVYRANIPGTSIQVALKLLPHGLAADPNYLARFRREALVGMRMNHPAIVRTIDFGEWKGTYYLAMEVVEGGTLDARLRRSAQLDEQDAFRLADDLLGAIDYAHKQGLIHRDIKPSNIIFDLTTGKPKLSDFGLAKDSSPDPSFMNAGFAVGTPHYMSPEQALGRADIDIRSDLYALGATLYHALTGTTPHQGSSTQQVLSRIHRHEPVVSPRQLNKNLSPGATAVIATLMARDRERRYATPADARADVRRVLAGEAPRVLPKNSSGNSGFMRTVSGVAHRVPASTRIWYRFPRRHPLLAMVALLAATGAICALVALLFLRR